MVNEQAPVTGSSVSWHISKPDSPCFNAFMSTTGFRASNDLWSKQESIIVTLKMAEKTKMKGGIPLLHLDHWLKCWTELQLSSGKHQPARCIATLYWASSSLSSVYLLTSQLYSLSRRVLWGKVLKALLKSWQITSTDFHSPVKQMTLSQKITLLWQDSSFIALFINRLPVLVITNFWSECSYLDIVFQLKGMNSPHPYFLSEHLH